MTAWLNPLAPVEPVMVSPSSFTKVTQPSMETPPDFRVMERWRNLTG